MDCELLIGEDRARWDDAHAAADREGDPYGSWAYHAAHAGEGHGVAEAVSVRDGARAFFLPWLRRPVPGDDGWSDAQSAQGYGGPWCNTDDPRFVAAAWGCARATLQSLRVVAAFLRLPPWRVTALDPSLVLRDDRATVSLDVRRGAAALLDGPDQANHRRMVAHARREGITARMVPFGGDGLARFAALYDDSMRRLDAPPEARYSHAYFEHLASLAEPRCALAEAWSGDGELAAAAVVLRGARMAHYHLAARVAGRDLGVGNLLLQHIAEDAEARGLEGVHLGGGRSPRDDDALFRFKARVGNRAHRFVTAGLVVEPLRAASLRAAWARDNGREPTWFLGWRQGPRGPSGGVKA